MSPDPSSPSSDGQYVPSPSGWVRKQVEAIEKAATTDAADIMGRPVVLLTMTGRKTGALRKVPLMRVEHDGVYAAVASKGGADEHPEWLHNLRAQPDIEVQDGERTTPVHAREIDGAEREQWWPRAVAAFPEYAKYQEKTSRRIPVFLLEPR